MPRSFRVSKPIDVQKGYEEGPNKLRMKAAIERRLKQNQPIHPTGRRNSNKPREVE